MTCTSSVLKDEINILERLNDLADQKSAALLKDDLVALQRVLVEEETAIKDLYHLEETRLQQAGQFVNDQDRESARQVVQRLLRMLKNKNEFNQTVLGESLVYTRFNVQLMMGDRQAPGVYGAEGKLENVNYKRLIDRKG